MFKDVLENKIKELWDLYHLSSGLKHSGEKGGQRERYVKQLFELILPIHFGVGGGIIVDSWGRQSPQFDLIIYDKRLNPPILSDSAGNGVYAFDSVLRVIEVKSQLDFGSLEQIKKGAAVIHPSSEHGLKMGKKGTLVDNQTYYPLYSVFAYESRVQDISAMLKRVEFLPKHVYFCVASRGTFDNRGMSMKPDGGSGFNHIRYYLGVVCQAIEETASSRGKYSIFEWLL